MKTADPAIRPVHTKPKLIPSYLGASLRGNRPLQVGILILTILIFVAVFAPILATHSPYVLSNQLVAPPSGEHFLGTDGLGRDVYSMILYGARTSLMIGVIAALISGIIGTLIGGIAGYYGGNVDRSLTEVNNIFLMMPTFFLILMIVAFFWK